MKNPSPFDKVLEIVVPIMQNLSPLPPFYVLMIGPRFHTFNRDSLIPYKTPWPNNSYCQTNSTNIFKPALRSITSYMHAINKKEPTDPMMDTLSLTRTPLQPGPNQDPWTSLQLAVAHNIPRAKHAHP